ncbi:prepilin-type N-terminal cleavage/methylation domain-containing protein [Couchioplanes azureus]|uniref:prepilin-type N-terminal cleavage/methylation domain-containing protein n=1 Tax=Couchioplanes caeruleus TaxID=56438 RepID=UPI00166F807C|nr:prepilin-type N-terminal cleavage/methylation domain-containing protein [Couchioplanes caeruleus]GGQ85443.1 hypothetical protein GCM10010166_64730 [Couchioplanes caeruleus subsp. azureus]
MIAEANERPGRPIGDAGVTLIEVMVAMTILSVITAMATTGIVGVLQQQRLATAYTDAQAQSGRAVLRLDREIRFAEDMELFSGTTARPELPDPSLAWVAVAGTATATPGLSCGAVSLKDGKLELRTWAASGTAAAAQPTILVEGVEAVGAEPFEFEPEPATVPGDGSAPPPDEKPETVEFHLRVRLRGEASSRPLEQRFVAPNSYNQGTYAVGTECF